MKIVFRSHIEGVFVFQETIYPDNRWYLFENFSTQNLANLGVDFHFKQSNISLSYKNVFRGMHFQKSFPQAKIIQILSGKNIHFALDIRPDSPTFGEVFSYVLEDKFSKIFLPKGVAHGFLSLEDKGEILYHCDEYYRSDDQFGISFLGTKIAEICAEYVPNFDDIILSKKDTLLPSFDDFCKIWLQK